MTQNHQAQESLCVEVMGSILDTSMSLLYKDFRVLGVGWVDGYARRYLEVHGIHQCIACCRVDFRKCVMYVRLGRNEKLSEDVR